MTNPMIKIHNVENGEVIEREMTKEETIEWELEEAKTLAEKNAKTEIEAAKAALLEKLGITKEEAKLLLS